MNSFNDAHFLEPGEKIKKGDFFYYDKSMYIVEKVNHDDSFQVTDLMGDTLYWPASMDVDDPPVQTFSSELAIESGLIYRPEIARKVRVGDLFLHNDTLYIINKVKETIEGENCKFKVGYAYDYTYNKINAPVESQSQVWFNCEQELRSGKVLKKNR